MSQANLKSLPSSLKQVSSHKAKKKIKRQVKSVSYLKQVKSSPAQKIKSSHSTKQEQV